jgi:glycosyltransferase involved in cell wall biosynthesis
MGHDVRVFALRAALEGRDELARERGVEAIPTSHNGLATNLAGIVEALRRPLLLLAAIRWLFATSSRNVAQLGTALAVLPRSFDILAHLERQLPDVLHTEWGHYPAIVAYLVKKRLPRTVISVSLIAYDLDAEFGGSIDVVREASVIRTQALVNVEKIAGFTGVDPSRVYVVYDGVDLDRIHRIHATMPKVPGRFVVAGRLIPEKGIDDAMRVFALAKARAKASRLRVLGDGHDLARLKQLADQLGVSDSVDFLGHVSHERVLEEFASAEIHLHMSHSERLPNVVKEAMACHCVCITTRTAGIEELVDSGVTGYVVEVGDVTRAADIATELLRGVTSMTAMGDAAHSFIEQNFDHDRNVHLLLDLWLRAKSEGSDVNARWGSAA